MDTFLNGDKRSLAIRACVGNFTPAENAAVAKCVSAFKHPFDCVALLCKANAAEFVVLFSRRTASEAEHFRRVLFEQLVVLHYSLFYRAT